AARPHRPSAAAAGLADREAALRAARPQGAARRDVAHACCSSGVRPFEWCKGLLTINGEPLPQAKWEDSMNRLVASTTAVLLGCASAQAADYPLYDQAYPMQEGAPPVWQGAYFGANVGWGTGKIEAEIPAVL